MFGLWLEDAVDFLETGSLASAFAICLALIATARDLNKGARPIGARSLESAAHLTARRDTLMQLPQDQLD
jgi:hypothetical protein